jgi:hypothetical protein
MIFRPMFSIVQAAAFLISGLALGYSLAVWRAPPNDLPPWQRITVTQPACWCNEDGGTVSESFFVKCHKDGFDTWGTL